MRLDFLLELTVGLFCLAVIPSLPADAQTLDTVLVRNVRLIDPEGQAEDRIVSVLIKDGKLDVVTEEEIPSGEADLALDGRNGILLGSLDLAQPASFLILDGDPREDAQLLLDTKTYASFAIVDGEIIKNTLPVASQLPSEGQVRRSGWSSYNPPPLSLPIRYRASEWNHWVTDYISGAFVSMLAIDRQVWLEQDDANYEQVGDLEPFDRGDFRGLRFGAVGTLNFTRPWGYTFFAATAAYDKGFDTTEDNNLILYDYRLDIPLGDQGTLSVGKQREPFSMGRIMGLLYVPIQERAAVSDAMMPSRNFGVVYNNTLAGERMSYAGGVFNNWYESGERFSESATDVIGRITGVPLVSEDETGLVHLGLGVRYSNARGGIRYHATPEVRSSPDFVDTGTGLDTGLFDADSTVTYDFELSARRGPIWFHSEFLATNVSAPEQGNPTFYGYHLTASWIITGEMRDYNKRNGTFVRLPVARPVTEGGWGTWEVGARWSSLDLTDGAIEGGDMQVLSIAVGWWPTRAASASLNFRNINLDRFGLRGNAKSFTARIALFLF